MTTAGIRDNNFDFLRAAAAFAVIVGHSFYLRGNPEQIPVIGGVPVHILGVAVFFVISGYLITKSRLGRNSPLQYTANRVLRIFPALIVVVVLSILVLGPLFSVLSNRQFFTDPGTLDYLWNIALRPAYSLPGVFGGLPYPGVVNGSLWTLPAEFFCYLVVLAIGFLPRRAVGYAIVVFGVLSIVGYFILLGSGERVVVWGTLVNDAARMWGFFAIGALLALAPAKTFFRLDVAVLATVVWLSAPLLGINADVVTMALLPYIVLSFGLSSTPVLRRTARFGDLSYGLYLYAFPVQQSLVALLGPTPAALNIVLVTVVTGLLAFGSWHLVEKRAMALRHRVGSRPLRLPIAVQPNSG
jgi:peptidoglycan/LPS O-acetylase OafA/YrhL